jgi:glycogen synthase
VHLNGYCHGDLPWSKPTLMVCHSCVLSWWQAVKGEAAPANWDRYRREVQSGLRSADFVIAPTLAMLESAKSLYGPFSQAKVIPNARDPRMFYASEKQPYVFAAGRFWDQAKNLSALAEAAGAIDWPVYVAGDSATDPGTVRGLGFLTADQMAEWLSRASIYALPALYEPFGLSILEAALSGCALVLGDIPSLRENWFDCALFVDPHDPTALADALSMLIGDPELREQLARQASRRALDFSIESFGSVYLQAYETLTAAHKEEGALVSRK